MPSDISVSLIMIKSDQAESISYIKFVMSDGSESPPVFTNNSDVVHTNDKTLVLDEASRPVRKIPGADNGACQIKRLDFKDLDGQVIDNYNAHLSF